MMKDDIKQPPMKPEVKKVSLTQEGEEDVARKKLVRNRAFVSVL